jgi:hypothetical protein
MASSYIVRLGPMDGAGGTVFFYSLLAGHAQVSAHVAATDDQALENIVFDHGRDDLVCEPLLAEAAERAGIPVQPLSRLASLGLAFLAYDQCPGQPLDRITEDGLVDQFCTMVAAYDSALKRLPDFVFEPLRLRVSGTVQFVTNLHVQRGVEEGEFLSIMMEKADGPAPGSPDSVAFLKAYNRIRVSRRRTPAFVLEALSRSYHLHSIPVPSRIVEGAEEHIQDLQLAIIISTLNAILHLRRRGDIGRSEFHIRDVHVDCDVGVDVG